MIEDLRTQLARVLGKAPDDPIVTRVLAIIRGSTTASEVQAELARDTTLAQVRPLIAFDHAHVENGVTIGDVAGRDQIKIGDVTIQLGIAAEPAIRLTRKTWRQWVRAYVTPVRLGLSTVVLLACIAGAFQIWSTPAVQSWLHGPTLMNGDLNLAVAQFGGLDSNGRVVELQAATDFANSVYDALQVELTNIQTTLATDGAPVLIEIHKPADTGLINGATREERATAAAKLARQLNADVIIYGNLQQGTTTSSFLPEFYVAEGILPDDEQLVGPYDFGAPIEFPGNLLTDRSLRPQLRAQLQARIHALSQFAFGLSHYAAGRFDRAAVYFQAAADSSGWAASAGKEVVYLFLGNTANKRRDFIGALNYYTQALALKPDYGRALVGMAEAQFLQASSDCSAGKVNSTELQTALATYQHAQQAGDQPSDAEIPAKTAFGIGRVYLCISEAGLADQWMDAEREFRQVIAIYEQGDGHVRNLAAEAHAHLALIASPFQDDPDSNTKYRQSITEWRVAISLSARAPRQGTFHAAIASYEGRLKEYDAADEDYNNAVRLDPVNSERYLELQQELRKERATRKPTPSATP